MENAMVLACTAGGMGLAVWLARVALEAIVALLPAGHEVA